MVAVTSYQQEEVINGFVEQLLDGGDSILLDEYCQKYPLLREALERKYKIMKALEEAFTEQDLGGTEIGDYLIVEEIGRGGMGVVYLALQQSLHRYVALKILPFGFTYDSGSIMRFRSEAQNIARFNHPNIVPVYSMGEEKGICYIAMALVPGLSLNKVLQGLRCFPPDKWSATMVRDIIYTHPDFIRLKIRDDRTGNPESISITRDTSLWNKPYPSFVLTLCAEIADALSYAHKNGICHGDLKPPNIMLTHGGLPMIVDFGLAKDMRPLRNTQSQDFIGTIAYAAPEHITRNIISPASEIWSLGVTMYEMLSPSPPFQCNDVAGTVERILKTDPPLLRKGMKSLPKDVETVVFKCLEKAPENRYARADLLKEDINNFLLSKPIMAKPIGRLGRVRKWAKRNRLVSTLYCALAILLMVGSFVALNSSIRGHMVEGDRYQGEGKYLEAMKSYESALKLLFVPFLSHKTKAGVLSRMGDAWSAMGKYEKAINSYEYALQVDPHHVSALCDMGDVYFERGQYEKARAYYDQIIHLSPQDRGSFYRRGKVHKEVGSYREALRDFHTVIQLAPNDSGTLKEISAMLSHMGLNSENDKVMFLRKEAFSEAEIRTILQLKDR
jgi:serine/threonine protein kinase